MKVKKIKYAALLILFYIFNYIFISKYTSGDQIYYRAFYDEIANDGLARSYIKYRAMLSSIEPVYFITSYIFSKIVPKDVYIAAINTFLYFTILQLLKKYKPRPEIYIFTYTNFYLYVISFSAERLKFAILFLIIYLLKEKKRYIGLSILSHIQLILFPITIYSKRIIINTTNIINRFKLKYTNTIYIFSTIIILYFLWPQIYYKLPFYIKNGGVAAVIKPSVIALIDIYTISKKRRSEVSIMYLPIIVAAFVLGSERITIAAFFLMYTNMVITRSRSALGLIVCTYFSFAGLEFLINILSRGTGFEI